jgi:hypothetical protein
MVLVKQFTCLPPDFSTEVTASSQQPTSSTLQEMRVLICWNTKLNFSRQRLASYKLSVDTASRLAGEFDFCFEPIRTLIFEEWSLSRFDWSLSRFDWSSRFLNRRHWLAETPILVFPPNVASQQHSFPTREYAGSVWLCGRFQSCYTQK